MFATMRSRQHVFVARKQRSRRWHRIGSFCTGVMVIAFGTWVGIVTAQVITGEGRLDNGIVRAINGLLAELLTFNPIVTGVAAGVVGLVALAYYLRDHN